MNFILYGEQMPMIKKQLKKILLERLGEPDEFNVAKFDYEECEINEIIDEASMLPLGYDKKAVVVSNCSFLTNQGNKEDKEKVLELLQNVTDDIDIILIYNGDKIDEKSPIFTIVKEKGNINYFLNLKKEDWPIYIQKYFKAKNVEISQDAINELALRVDGDLNKFLNEADKLCLYKDVISLMDVTLLVSRPLEDDVFQISNALLRGDNASAISIFRDLKLLGSRSTDTLIPMLGTQFRFISQVMFLSHKGLNKSEIASELNTSEGRVGVTLRNTKYLSRRQVAHALDDLYYLDYQIKSGQIDRFYGFELFLINFPN